MNIVVVGAGLIGATIGFTLHKAGYHVTLLDAQFSGAAWRAGAGLLTPDGENLRGTMLEGDAKKSLAMWPKFAQRLEQHSGHAVGWREGIKRLLSDGSWENTSGEGRIYPPQVVRASRTGLEIIPAHAQRIQPHQNGAIVKTNLGEFPASLVVLATGAWSKRFGLDVFAVQGQALVLDGPTDHPALYGQRKRGVGARPYALGRPDGLYMGATVRHTHSVQPDQHAERWLRTAALDLIPAHAKAPKLKTLVGLRPYTPSGLPLIGQHPTLTNTLVACGHGRHGALLAPLTAQRILDTVRKFAPPPTLNAKNSKHLSA